MKKKILSAIMALTLVFTVLGFGTAQNASAKSYRSFKRSYTPSYQQPARSNSFNQHSNTNQNQSTYSKTKQSFSGINKMKNSSGGFLKGLFLGGLGGMLFSHLFGGAGYGFGFLGSIFSLIINLIIIGIVISIISRIFRFRRRY